MWRIGLAFLLGQCAVHVLVELPPIWPYLAALVIAGAAAAYFRRYALLALALGFGWTWLHAHSRLAGDLPPDLEGEDVVVIGHVASIPDVRDVDAQFEFDVISASDARVPDKIRLAWYDSASQPQPGERWELVVRLKRRNGFANPGGFDYEGFLFRGGIGATGYVRDDAGNRKVGEGGLGYAVLRLRAHIATRISKAVADAQVLGVLQGLAVGDTHAMTSQQWRVFSATGTAHLMAISGLHISMLAALAAFVGRRIVYLPLAQRWRITSIRGEALAGTTAAIAYSLLAGMSIPTQRTLIMLCVFFMARLARRELSVGHALGLSLLGVLLIDPFAAQSVGAWLSFGAVAIILLAVNGRLEPERAWKGFARAQWAVTLGLVPLLVIAFGSVSLVAPFANIVAVPVFSFVVVPMVLLGAATACISIEAGGFVLGGVVHVLDVVWPLLEWLAAQPISQWYLPDMAVWQHAGLAVGMVLLVLPGVMPMRTAAVFLCVPPLLFRPAGPAEGAVELSLLDVGQGLATIVRTRSHMLVYDTGPAFHSGRDTGELVVVPYLRSLGVRQIDRLIVSHGDLDHQGGMNSVLAELPTRSVLVGPSVATRETPVEPCRIGQQWTWDGVVFEIVHPQLGFAAGDNDTSCVLRIATRAGSVLLTGDIEAEGEAALVSSALGPVDVVLIPHHGSRTSSSEAFVEATRPRLALVSAGYRNRWGFPKGDVIARWRDKGAVVYSTIESGALLVSINEESGIRVRHYRQDHKRYWSSR